MTVEEWKAYYKGMVLNGIRPHKVKEMVERCGGLIEEKTLDDEKERLIAEIKEIPFKVGGA